MPKAKISEHYKQARKGYNKPQKESKSKGRPIYNMNID